MEIYVNIDVIFSEYWMSEHGLDQSTLQSIRWNYKKAGFSCFLAMFRFKKFLSYNYLAS